VLELPGLLQVWGIAVIASIVAVFAALFYLWHRADRRRPAFHLDVLAIGLLAFLTGGFFWRVLTESAVMMPVGGGDVASFYYPTYLYAASQIKEGILPLWNPYLFAGMPLAADIQSALFYPINWILYLFVDVNYGSIEWLLIFHYWLASAFMYLFLRDLRLSRAAALGGGIAFAFCGFMTAHLGHLPMILVAAWLPLSLLCLRRAYFTSGLGGWAWSIGSGLSMAVSLFAGHAQIFSYSMIAVGLLWVVLLFDRKPFTDRNALSWAGKGFVAMLVLFGLGAMQLLPSIELSNQSVRSAISYEEASAFSAQPITLLNLLLPRVYGGNPGSYSPGDWQSTENWGYCGVITLALAAAALLFRRRKMLTYFAILLVLALLIMLGDLTVVGAWLYSFLPGFSSLRSTGRGLFLFGFALAGLAAFGLDGLLTLLRSHNVSVRRAVKWWLVGVSSVVAVAGVFVMPLFFSQTLQLNGAQSSRLPQAINDLGVLMLWLGLLAGVGWACWRGRMSVGIAGALIVGLLVLDIFSPNSLFNPTTDNLLAGFQQYTARTVTYKLTRDKTTNIPFRLDSDSNAQDQWQPSTALLVSAEDPDVQMYDTGGAFNPLKLRRYDYLWGVAKDNFDSPLYDLAGARMRVVSSSTVLTNTQKWKPSDVYPAFRLYQDLNAMPRVFLVHDARIDIDGFHTVNSLRDFSVDPRHTVLLESGTGAASTVPGTAEASSTNETVVAKEYKSQDVVLDVSATSPGWVVLSDAWYPGWEATVNGQSVPVEIADHAFRAVRVDAGQSTIIMQFRPATWAWGSLISLLTFLATALALATILVVGRRMAEYGSP
jgi:Bacterial membrane protein YfhO